MADIKPFRSRPPYLIGILCLIPLIGAFVGVVLIVLGIVQYKDKILIAIGAAGVLITVLVYSGLFYFLQFSKFSDKSFIEFSQADLNGLPAEVEFYKFQHGAYPDSLQQILQQGQLIIISDPILTRKLKVGGNQLFRYKKFDDKYTLFSVGLDEIPFTTDDLFPVIPDSLAAKYGYVKPTEKFR